MKTSRPLPGSVTLPVAKATKAKPINTMKIRFITVLTYDFNKKYINET